MPSKSQKIDEFTIAGCVAYRFLTVSLAQQYRFLAVVITGVALEEWTMEKHLTAGRGYGERTSIKILTWAIPTILTFTVSVAGFQVSGGSVGPRMDVIEPRLSVEQWRADLRFFASEMESKHLNAFHYVTRQRFEDEVAQLDRKLPDLGADGVFVGLQRLACLIGDGHTYVRMPNELTRYFPVLIRQFGSDYRVVGTAPGLESALGTRLVKVQDTPVARAVELLLPLTPQDEPGLAPVRIPAFLRFANMLHGLGIIASKDSARYTFVDDAGREVSLELHSVSSQESGRIEYVQVLKTTPLYLRKPEQSLWFTFLPESKTVYCQFHTYDKLAERGKELMEFVKQQMPDKLIIDLRRNQGGDYFEGWSSIVHPIASNPDINKRGHLFVLIGPATFSAALANATHFRYQTAAILVGEPIGEKPNSYAEPRDANLPNSHFIFRYQIKYYQFVKTGENLVRPDQQVATSWEEYKAGRDPALEWILKYEAR